MKKTEASEVGVQEVKQLTQEQEQIVQIAKSCVIVFELASRSVPSNHAPTVMAEVTKLEAIAKGYE